MWPLPGFEPGTITPLPVVLTDRFKYKGTWKMMVL